MNEYKNKRIEFRKQYDRLNSNEAKEEFLKNNNARLTEIIESGYLYLDERDGTLYDCMFIEKTQWLAQNFALKAGELCEEGKYGWEQFVSLCPEGWRLPNRHDFDDMIYAAETLVANARGIDILEIDTPHDWDVFEMLQESLDLEFNAGYAFYGGNELPFWTEEQEWFYMYEGQNEGVYGRTHTGGGDKLEKVAYVRYVRDV